MEVTADALARFFDVVLPHMNEVQRRVVAGAVSAMLGRGGKTAVATASGMSRSTVIKAEAEVAGGFEPSDRLRAPGGGDKPLIDKQPGLLEALDGLVYPGHEGQRDVIAALDVEVLHEAGRRPRSPRVRRVAHRAAPVAPSRLLAASQRQSGRGLPTSRS